MAWHKCTNMDIELYKSHLDNELDSVNVPYDAIVCRDIFCKSKEHRTSLNVLCQNMVQSCMTASNEALPHTRPHGHTLPFWNEKVEPLKEKSLFWHWVWIDCGKPHDGIVAQIMRSTRARYHLAVKEIKRNENELRRARMGEAVSLNRTHNLWDEAKRMMPSGQTVSNEIEGATNPESIAEVFANKFEALYQSVPTDVNELESIKTRIKGLLINENSLDDCNINVNDIQKAIKMLNKQKSDGDKGFYSDHVILSTHKFMVLLMLLVNSMLIHGYNADDLLVSVIASIPKCIRSSLDSSDNYRGIALCCSLCKVIDYVFINKYLGQLQSSNLQFAFKEGHDTTMCTAVLKETVSYYLDRDSDVYACLLDASKAFDRVHFGKLFSLLLDKKMPAVVVRLLLDNYTRQKIDTAWNGKKSREFTAVNGVRQGGVLSPLLFNIYFDEMLKRLKSNGVGCNIGKHFIGALAYADDVTLLCPSKQGLQEMINTCKEFGEEYCVKFNDKKTQCINFSQRKTDQITQLQLNGGVLAWESSVNHLGNTIDFRLNDSNDILKKKGVFIGSVNKLMSNYSSLQSHVLIKLFQNSCCSFYGATLWNFNTSVYESLCVAWNKALRRVWRLPYMTHTCLLGPLNGQIHIADQLNIRFIKFVNRMVHSCNPIVSFIGKYSAIYGNGFIYKEKCFIN